MAMLFLLLLSLRAILIKSEAKSQLVFSYHVCNDNLGNFTVDSTYGNYLNTLLSQVLYSDENNDYGFYNSSYGENPDKVYAIGLCRGYAKPENCRSCLAKSAVLLRERCPTQKEAIGWFDDCMIRYTNHTIIFDIMEYKPDNTLCNNNNVTNTVRFDEALNGLVDGLRSRAADGDSRRKFSEGDAPVKSSNETIYALVQCTPDLSKGNCTKCLQNGMSNISYFCDGKIGGQYMSPRCYVRYETSLFFEPIVQAPAPHPFAPLPTITTGKGKNNQSRAIVLSTVVPAVAVLVLVLLIYYLRGRRRTRRPIISEDEGEGDDEGEPGNDIKTDELLQFDFATIRFATENFSDANKLGEGGFGIVYKGTLSDGQEIAIKRLSINSNQGDTEFKNEILLTGKLQHRNLVRLLGFCFAKRERLLIYEFVPNKSLDYLIFDPNKRVNLNWETRYKIIKGIARGLLYLHEDSRLQVVHRDLKTSNILLDEELNPKISDFGMARLFDISQTQATTSTIVGTFGYMAPEYIKHGHFSVKSDVFSFGVMILEIVCGQRNSKNFNIGENAQDLLISIAWKNWKEETISEIIDPTLKYYSGNEIKRCIHVGLLCVQEDVANRPVMNSVLLMLTSSSFPLAEPSEPAFLKRGQSSPPRAMLSGDQYSEATRSSDSGSQYAQGSSNKDPINDPYPR